MNTEIKVSLTIALPGGTMFSKEDCLKTVRKVIEKKSKSGKVYKKTIKTQIEDLNMMNSNRMEVRDKNNSNPEIISFYTRKIKPATQSISISRESYDYMVSTECPSGVSLIRWKAMQPYYRLVFHLNRIAEGLGGHIVSFKIFDD